MSEEKVHVIISHVRKDGRSFLEIKYVPGERLIEIDELAQILTGGLGIAIRAAGKGDKFSEHEIMKAVVEHLTDEFVNPDSFKDIGINEDYM
jgi:hypothetical protein